MIHIIHRFEYYKSKKKLHVYFKEIIFLASALLGFVTVFLIGKRYQNNQQTNVYLVAIFATSSIRFLFRGLVDFSTEMNFLKQLDLLIFVSTSPLVFLYFKKLVIPANNIKKDDVFHLLVPVFLFISLNYTAFYYQEVIAFKTRVVVLLIVNIFYALKSFRVLNELVWKRTSEILIINKQNIWIKKWTYILFSFYIFMFLRFILYFIANKNGIWYLNNDNYLWVTAFVWIVLYLKIIHSPEFLYGYDLFQSKIKEYKKNNIVFDHIWILSNTELHKNIQHNILNEKIKHEIENYITQIEKLTLDAPKYFKESFKLKDLSNQLNIPKSHMVYLFKYHSKISFNDFKKIIRIQNAVSLIKNDYLKVNTLEALATEIGFSSYSAFFKSFKSVIGISPKEYCDRL